ncbi:MAG: ATP synthase F1 subunit delta [Fidelibacterota bacterium]
MATNKRRTRVYARSILSAALKANEFENVYNRIVVIDRLYKSIPEFRLLLQSRRIDVQTKTAIIKNVLKDVATPIELELFDILFEKNEINLFNQIITQFLALAEKESSTVNVTISTANKISEQSIKEILDAVGESTGMKVKHRTQISPGLLGGITLRIGNKIVDGSVSKRLEKLKMSLLRA